jgi:hypothetical protein
MTMPAGGVRDAPAWWSRELRVGQSVDLIIYGERMKGRLAGFTNQALEVVIPLSEQSSALRGGTTVHGAVTISIEGGAATAPVSCWPINHMIRLQITGPVELVQRRQHARRDVDAMVALTWENEGGQWERVISRTADISIGGTQVRSANIVWPSPGTPVWLTIDLPGGLPLQTEAEAVGKTLDYGLRLRFKRVPPEIEARITAFVSGG